METTLFQSTHLPQLDDTTAADAETAGTDTALDLRLHYTGLAHFFASFAPAARHPERPTRLKTTRADAS